MRTLSIFAVLSAVLSISGYAKIIDLDDLYQDNSPDGQLYSSLYNET